MTKTRNKLLATTMRSVAGVLLSGSVLAHHGSVTNPRLYEAENLTELEGVITDVFWRSPHPRFRLIAVDDAGEETTWELELNGNPIGYARAGITADDIAREGDRVRVAGYIAKADSNAMGVLHMLLPNGKEFVNGRNREPRWSTQRLAGENKPIDPSLVAAARESARGVFRVWGPIQGRSIDEADYDHILTDEGRARAEAYDPVADNAELSCKQGMPNTMFDRGSPMVFIDEGDHILIKLQEYDIRRTIHMDGAEPPVTLSDLGHSIGHWEGDALVVATSGVHWPYYDETGTPQSDEVSFVERFEPTDGGNKLNYTITINDPVVLSEPLTVTRSRTWNPGREVETYDCTAVWEEAAG